MKNSTIIKATGILAFVILSAGSLYAGAPPPPPPPPLGVPVDAGALFLLIAGAAFGASKLAGNNTKEEKH